MAKKIIGLCTCPECHFDEAEVKETKAGLAYRWCPECNAQYFPRCTGTSDRLKVKCHALAEPEAGPEPAPVREREQEPAKAAPPKLVAVRAPSAGPFDFILKKNQKEGAPA